MRNVKVIFSALSLALIASSAQAQRVGVGVKLGSMGPGVDLTCRLHPKLNVRAGFVPGPSIDTRFETEELAYDFGVRIRSISGLVDWHPYAGSFHLTGGLVWNGNRVSARTTPVGAVQIGDEVYEPEEIGVLEGRIGFRGAAPYLGLGWGNAVAGGRFGFTFDTGVLFQGAPRATLESNGLMAYDERFQDDLRQEAASLSDSVSWLSVYPVINLGLRFRI